MELLHDTIEDLQGTELAVNTWEHHEMDYHLDSMVGQQISRILTFHTGNVQLPYQTVVALGYVTGMETSTSPVRVDFTESDTEWIYEADRDFEADRAAAAAAGVDMNAWDKTNTGLGAFRWTIQVGWSFSEVQQEPERLAIRLGRAPRSPFSFPTLVGAENDLLSALEGFDPFQIKGWVV